MQKTIGKRLTILRKHKYLTQDQVAEGLGIKRARYNAWENGISDPPLAMITKLADFFDVSTDYLLGQSIGSLIEERLSELGMSLEDLSEQTKIPLANLQRLDNSYPEPWDYEPDGIIDRLAQALKLNQNELAVAYARQEPPAYDGPRTSAKEDFAEPIKDSNADEFDEDVRSVARDYKELESGDQDLFKAMLRTMREQGRKARKKK